MADMLSRSMDVLVVGAGPAGIAAACEAAESGCRVAVIDDNPDVGGQIWRGGKRPAASPAAASWFERLDASGAAVHAGTAVVDALPGPVLVTRHGEQIERWQPRHIILATGARERFLPFPGWTLPGVVGAGGLQALVKQGLDVAGKRIVLAGSGPLLLAVGELLAQKGAQVLAIVEQAPLGRLMAFACGLLAQPSKLIQAVAIRRTIGNVLRTGTVPERVRADQHGLVVSLASGPAGRERRVDVVCDLLACGFGLVPNLELPRALGCAIDHGRVAIDPLGRTSIDGIWAAGECTGVGGVDTSLVAGRIAGLAAAGRHDRARQLLPAADRAKRFARSLDRTFALDPRLARLANDATIVCRCEDVTAGRLRCHTNWREAKLLTRIGMGPCQGRVCGPAAAVLFGWSPEDVRPPFIPTRLSEIS